MRFIPYRRLNESPFCAPSFGGCGSAVRRQDAGVAHRRAKRDSGRNGYEKQKLGHSNSHRPRPFHRRDFSAAVPSRACYGSVIEPVANGSRTASTRLPGPVPGKAAESLDSSKKRHRLSNGFLTEKATGILKVSHLSDKRTAARLDLSQGVTLAVTGTMGSRRRIPAAGAGKRDMKEE